MYKTFLNFNFKFLALRYVADPSADDFLEHRMTLRVGMIHPALRVTVIKFLFKIDAFFMTFTVIFDKFSKKVDFFKIFNFLIFLAPIAKLRSHFQPQ